MTLIKSISGIRGTIGGAPGEGLSPVDIVKFTYAYCEKMKERLCTRWWSEKTHACLEIWWSSLYAEPWYLAELM